MAEFSALKELFDEIGSRYEILEYLSDDSQRPTLLLREISTRRKFVGKVYFVDETSPDDPALPQTDHPGVVQIIGIIEKGVTRCVIRPYIKGVPLDEAFAPPCDTDKVISVGMSLIQALETIHAQGIIHRDIKPRNIIVKNGGGGRSY